MTGAAQVPGAKAQMEAIIESILENIDEETDATLIIEDLEGYADDPLNVNAAGRDQLSRLHLLNDIQIQNLLDYRKEFGPVYSIYELNAVDGLNPVVLKKMEPFVWFGPVDKEPESLQKKLKYGRHEIITRTLGTIQKPRGYQQRDDGTIPFEGNRFRYYSRYRFRAGNNISAGITAEKDPGEAFFSGSNKTGFDFYSGHISFRLSPVFENVMVGDFVVRSGQGLVLWQGYSFGKSVYALEISKTNQGIRPYTSVDENRFFRGVASTINLSGTRVSLFYSQKHNDANLAFTDSLGNYFTSLQTSGYHRTENEVSDERSVKDVNAGAVISK
ncbi:MAG: helix-hairpin-helix domain-containing protein, partial [Tangfeifania sp.]